MIRSLAGHNLIRPIGDDQDDDLNRWSGFDRTKLSNRMYRSVVDPEARLMRKGDGGVYISHSMHLMTDSASGLCVDLAFDAADGRVPLRGGGTGHPVARSPAEHSDYGRQRAARGPPPDVPTAAHEGLSGQPAMEGCLIEPVIGWCKDMAGWGRPDSWAGRGSKTTPDSSGPRGICFG